MLDSVPRTAHGVGGTASKPLENDAPIALNARVPCVELIRTSTHAHSSNASTLTMLSSPAMLRIHTVPTPTKRITTGLAMAHEGLADLRAERERVAIEQDRRTAALVDAEGQLRVLAVRSARARRSRHLQPTERCGPRAQARDGAPSVTAIDARTQASLEVYGLYQSPSEPRRTLEDKVAWRRIFGA